MRHYVTHLKDRDWKRKVPNFDHNCKKRLYGFIQGAFYRLLDDGEFNPNFLVKRKIEVPEGDVDAIAKIIVEFVPVWEIFRSSSKDFWSNWTQILV